MFLALFFAWPLWQILAAADGDALRWLSTPYFQGRLAVAFEQAIWSVFLAMALAIPLAWLHHTRRIRHSNLHLAIHAAPFVLPVFVVVYGIQGLLGAGGWSDDLLGLDVLGAVGPVWTIAIAHAYYNYGLAARILHAGLERRPHHLEDAARTLGSTRIAAFVRVSLPLLLPSLAAAALLVFVFTFASFGVVLLMGGGAVSTLETLLYGELQGIRPDHGRAAVLGILQLLVNAVLLGGYLWLRRRDPFPSSRRLAPPSRLADLVSWSSLLVALIPALTVLIGSVRIRGEWTLLAWRAVLDAGHPHHLASFDLPRALGLSLGYAATSMLLAVAMTLILATLRGRMARFAEFFASIPLGVSSVLLGFGYLITFGAGSLLDLRGQPALIVIAHTLVSFPFVARVLLPAFSGFDRRLEEQALLLGARPWSVLWRVQLPILRGPLLVAIAFAVALSFGDFGASLILMQEDTMGLSVWIHRHDRPFNPILRAEALVLTTILMAMVAAAYTLIERRRFDL